MMLDSLRLRKSTPMKLRTRRSEVVLHIDANAVYQDFVMGVLFLRQHT